MPKENREFTSHVMISQNNDQMVMQIFILADADGSNFDWLNDDEYKNIQYCGKDYYDLKNDGNAEIYHVIEFHNFANLNTFCQQSFQEFLVNALDNANQHELTYEEALKEIMSYFNRDTTTNFMNTIHNDMAEALLVLQLLEFMDINQILESQKVINDKVYYAFHNQLIKTEMTSNLRYELRINSDELIQSEIVNEEVKINELNIFLVQVDYRAHQTNVLDLYQMVQDKLGFLPHYFVNKQQIYQSVPFENIDNESIILANTHYCLINESELPEIKIINPKNLISLNYVLNPQLFENKDLCILEQLKAFI